MEFVDSKNGSLITMDKNGDNGHNGDNFDNGFEGKSLNILCPRIKCVNDHVHSYLSETENYMPANEFELVNSVLGDGIQKDKEVGISSLCFDNFEEMLWMGTKSGHVTSYYGTQMQKYISLLRGFNMKLFLAFFLFV